MTAELQKLFDRKMHALCPSAEAARLAVAVSGGSDSMALALLADTWARSEGRELFTVTVDHGLRANSRAEAEQVGRWMAARGISHDILTWRGPHPATGIQARAREARYDLMADFCRARDIDVLLLGHQLEDQLETLLMRLSKGSGLDGLAAIQPVAKRGDLTLLRPLLEMRRGDLREYLDAAGQDWIDDPSNENPAFTRTRLGTLLKDLQDLPGSSLETIALSARRLGRASAALDQLTAAAFDAHCHVSPFGFVDIPKEVFRENPEEIGLRLLARAVGMVSGEGARLRLRALEDLYERLVVKGSEAGGTLAGCQITPGAEGFRISREPGRRGLPELRLSGRGPLLWDGRYRVMDMAAEAGGKGCFAVRRIGPAGWRLLKDQPMTAEEKALPARVRHNLPAVWAGEELVAAPLFSCNFAQSSIAKNRFKMVFRALIP